MKEGEREKDRVREAQYSRENYTIYYRFNELKQSFQCDFKCKIAARAEDQPCLVNE